MNQVTQEQRSLQTDGEALSLYEQDFLLWSEDTAAKLKTRDFENLDFENLIEEVESLGRSERRELLNRLTRLLEHLLKRLYVPSQWDYNGWELTIRNQRIAIKNLLKDSPSLKSTWESNIDYAWRDALKGVEEDYPKINFPDRFPYASDVDTLLNQKYWEIDS